MSGRVLTHCVGVPVDGPIGGTEIKREGASNGRLIDWLTC